MVKSIALEKLELQGLRHSFWAGFWRRTISVGFQRDIARSALNIQSQLLAVRSMIYHVDHIDDIFLTSVGCSMVMHITLYYSTCTLPYSSSD